MYFLKNLVVRHNLYTYFRGENLLSIPIIHGRNPKPKESAKWHKTIKIRTFMVLINRKREEEMIR